MSAGRSDTTNGVKRVTPREWAMIVGVGLALRILVAFVVLGRMPLVSEGDVYSSFGLRLLADFPGHESYYLPPGTSMVLAGVYEVFGTSVTVSRIVAITESIALVALMPLLARELTKDERAVRISTWIAALYAPSVLLSGQPYTQHLAALCVLAFALFGFRAVRGGGIGNYAVAGAALGVGCLTRPSMASLVLVLVAAVALAFRRASDSKGRLAPVVGAVILLGVAALPVVPVLVHNHAYGAGWTISTNNERNLFLGNNPFTPNYKTSHFGQRELEQLEPGARAYLESFYRLPDAREAMKREAVSFIVHHPLITAYRTFNRTTSFWGFDYIASRIIQDDMRLGNAQLLPTLALEAGSYVVVMIFVVAALFANAGPVRDSFTLKWLVAIALAYELPYAIAFSGGTFHFPVVGVLMPIAALAIAHGPRAMLAKMKTSRAVWIALAVLFAIQIEYAYYTLVMSA